VNQIPGRPGPRGTRRDAAGRLRYTPTGPAPKGPDQRLSALPSQLARVLAFAAILIGGACGALIGYGVMRLQYPSGHNFGKAVGTIISSLIVAIGVAVLSVLVLRAMGEWRAPRIDVGQVSLGDDRRE
jgi:hypothetical protein